MLQERCKEDVQLIQLPVIFNEEERGFFECCEPELVLGSNTTDSWKNDITPAWVKMYSGSDSATFTLKKNGEDAIYQPEVLEFPEDEFSRYVEIHWKDVLASDGIGCYTIFIETEIAGMEFSYNWQNTEYNLLPYSIENARGTARLRAVFNHFHEIEGIDFKGANVNGTIRFYGQIDGKKPNTEVSTFVYANREINTIVAENIPSWEMKTDPLKEQRLEQIVDLYLLSNVELYISDYNKHSHSYKTLDLPVYLKETAEVEYTELTRIATLMVTLWKRQRNERTYYS